MDVNHELDLFATASEKKCCLRALSTGKRHLSIKSTLDEQYGVFSILLSSKGYLVMCSRTKNMAEGSNGKDIIEVFSINGEKVVQRVIDGNLNALLFDETGYFLTVGGTSGKLYIYELLTMELVEYRMAAAKDIFPSAILSLNLLEDNCLLVGLAEKNTPFAILKCQNG